MANFVTFGDKLGHVSTTAWVFWGVDDSLSCEIKVLEEIDDKGWLAPKMQIC